MSAEESRMMSALADDLSDEGLEGLELELGEARLEKRLAEEYGIELKPTISKKVYFEELFRLQTELVKLQDWVKATGHRLIVIFEGRDSAGKGGMIKRITQRLDPRVFRVVALPAPSDREKTQWYFQRYAAHLPAAGEVVLFDRSWYNRAGVEKVMGFASSEEVEQFYEDAPAFERMLTRSGIKIIKYWISLSDAQQQLRFLMRIHDSMKQWKLSPMDLQSRIRWEDYTKAKEEMLNRTNSPDAPWYVIQGDDKKAARLNCIEHLLAHIPYREQPYEPVELPERRSNPDYERETLPEDLFVPEKFSASSG